MRRQRKGIMLCYPFEEKRLKKWATPYVVQPKYDGIRCRAIPTLEGYILVSSEENILYLPHIIEALNNLNIYLELDGEIYRHGMPFEQIASIACRTTNIHPAVNELEFHVFDIVSPDPQIKRLSDLLDIPFKDPVFAAPYSTADSLDTIVELVNYYVKIGYEGIVVRNILAPYERKRSTNIMKFKPMRTDIYRIVGYKEEISIYGVAKNSLGALEVWDGTNNFWVGSGFTHKDRTLLWEVRDELIGKCVKIAYQHTTTKNYVPRFPVFIEIINDGEE